MIHHTDKIFHRNYKNCFRSTFVKAFDQSVSRVIIERILFIEFAQCATEAHISFAQIQMRPVKCLRWR